MSYTTIYLVPESGPITPYADFRNSWLGGWSVWDNLAKLYLGREATHFMLEKNMQAIWDLAGDDRLPDHHKLVLMSTFDTAMVKRDDCNRLADAFTQYARDFPQHGHIPEQAKALRQLADDPECFAVCWRQTSVSADVWRVFEDEESRPYDISIDDGHWFMFEEVDNG